MTNSDQGGGQPRKAGATTAPAVRDFVGRERELVLLERALRVAAEGRGQIAMVAGEAGIGKTRLLEELALRARQTGATVLWGGCDEARAGGVYGVFREALDGYVRDAEDPPLRTVLGARAGVLARLVPRIRDRFPDLPEPVPLRPDEERTRLLDAVSQCLIGIAKQTPVLLVLDDLHWAEPDAVALLRHVGRMVAQQPVLLVGAYRAAEVEEEAPLADTLALLQRQPRFEPVRLPGLAADAVAELLCVLTDALPQAGALTTIDRALVDAVQAQTGGNPFFVRSLGRQLVAEGTLCCVDGRWQLTRPLDEIALPDSVRQVLRRQIKRLTAEAQRFLTVAAGVGQTFRFDVAAAVAELSEERALEVVDEALAAQLIEAGEAQDTYAFVHALVRQTLYEVLNPSRQVRLHRKIAEGMEETYDERATEHAAEIAEHYHRSRSLIGGDRGVTYPLVAAGQAERCFAFAEAAAYLRMALDLLTTGDERRPHLLCRLGRNLVLAQEAEHALVIIREAAPLIERTQGPAAAAEYLADLLSPLFAAGVLPAAFEVARIGLPYARDRRDATWASLAAIGVIEREFADPEHPGITIDSPEREQIGALFAQVAPTVLLPSYAYQFLQPGADPGADIYWRGEYRRGLARLYEWAAQRADQLFIGNASDSWNLWATIARCHIALGELTLARAALERSARLAERLPSAIGTSILLAALDDWRAARDLGWHRIQDVPLPTAVPWYQASRDAVFARLHARMGRVEPALSRLSRVIRAIERGFGDSYMMIADRAAETLWLTAHSADIDTIERNIREKIVATGYRYPMTDGRLALARLCALQGRDCEALEWFAKARAVLDEQGARPLRAIVDYDEALMYARRGEPGDCDRARPLLEAALTQFHAIGMPGWIRRAEHLMATGTEWSAVENAAPAAIEPPAVPRLGKEGAAEPLPPARAVFRLEGEFWTITYGATTFRLKHGRGLTFLAMLLREPGREIAATELVARGARNGDESLPRPHPAPLPTGRRNLGLGDAGEVLDAQARATYKQRLHELREELAEAEGFNDSGRSERLREEIDFLSAEVARAVGLGGRERRAGSHAERARVNVTRAISLVLAKISESHPGLGAHFGRTIKTGTLCSYAPDPRAPIEWETSA